MKKVKYISSENTSLKLSWNSVLGANAYVITAESINNLKTFTKTVYGRAEGEIEGLIDGNEYIVTVRAIGYDSKAMPCRVSRLIIFLPKQQAIKSAALKLAQGRKNQ